MYFFLIISSAYNVCMGSVMEKMPKKLQNPEMGWDLVNC